VIDEIETVPENPVCALADKNLIARFPFTKLQTKFMFWTPYIPAVLLIGAPHKNGGHIRGSHVEYVIVYVVPVFDIVTPAFTAVPGVVTL
jgi:hypothetical protein